MYHFQTVRLDLRADHDLTPLLQALSVELSVGGADPTATNIPISLELRTEPTDPASAIRDFVAVIDHLAPESLALWNGTHRTFSIEVSGVLTGNIDFPLSPELLQLIVRVGAAITFVVYPPEKES